MQNRACRIGFLIAFEERVPYGQDLKSLFEITANLSGAQSTGTLLARFQMAEALKKEISSLFKRNSNGTHIIIALLRGESVKTAPVKNKIEPVAQTRMEYVVMNEFDRPALLPRPLFGLSRGSGGYVGDCHGEATCSQLYGLGPGTRARTRSAAGAYIQLRNYRFEVMIQPGQEPGHGFHVLFPVPFLPVCMLDFHRVSIRHTDKLSRRPSFSRATT